MNTWYLRHPQILINAQQESAEKHGLASKFKPYINTKAMLQKHVISSRKA